MNHRMRRIFTMKRYELEFPLKHPRYVIEHVAFKDRHFKVLGWNHPWIKVQNSLEELFLNLKQGNFKMISASIHRRLGKWLGSYRHH